MKRLKKSLAICWGVACGCAAAVAGGCTYVVEAPLPQGFPQPAASADIVVKQYPAARMAVARRDSDSQDGMFMRLFRHIDERKIPMTAPVTLAYGDDDATAQRPQQAMGFYYPRPDTGQAGSAGSVAVVDVPPVTVVSTAVAGAYTEDRFRRAIARLRRWLDGHRGQYVAAGPPRVLAYNSPLVPWFLKYSEVQIPVRRVSSADDTTGPGHPRPGPIGG